MDPRLPVSRAAETLGALVKAKTAGRPVQSLQQLLPSIQMMQYICPEWTFKTCRLTHPELGFISSNCQQLFGYKPDRMTQMGQNDLYAYVPEEDCEELYNCLLFLQNFYSDQKPEDFHKVRSVMQYRFIRRDGTIINLRDEKAAVSMGESNYLYYTMYKDVSREVLFSGIKLSVYSNITGEKITEYRRPTSQANLSDREGELLLLIRGGLTTKEMAWKMNISHHTVRNIRQRMFEKFNVSNSIELINKTAHII
jgi:DNA-binding CsgD family transcriptional regulator